MKKRFENENKILIVEIPYENYEGLIRGSYEGYVSGDFRVHTNLLKTLKEI